jgi:hypothetical protein
MMMYYREDYASKCVDIWKRRYYLSEIEIRYNLIFVVYEVIMQTRMKGKFEYIIKFGDILLQVLKDFIKYFCII